MVSPTVAFGGTWVKVGLYTSRSSSCSRGPRPDHSAIATMTANATSESAIIRRDMSDPDDTFPGRGPVRFVWLALLALLVAFNAWLIAGCLVPYLTADEPEY